MNQYIVPYFVAINAPSISTCWYNKCVFIDTRKHFGLIKLFLLVTSPWEKTYGFQGHFCQGWITWKTEKYREAFLRCVFMCECVFSEFVLCVMCVFCVSCCMCVCVVCFFLCAVCKCVLRVLRTCSLCVCMCCVCCVLHVCPYATAPWGQEANLWSHSFPIFTCVQRISQVVRMVGQVPLTDEQSRKLCFLSRV